MAVAHDVLGDPEKRARFDRGEIDATGAEQPRRSCYRSYAQGDWGGRYRGFDGEDASFDDELFGDPFRSKGPVSLPEAMLGDTVDLPTVDGKIAIKIPPGVTAAR